MSIDKIYSDIREKVNQFIRLAEENKDKYHLVAVFDTLGNLDALSGIVYPMETENIETGFVCVTKNYTGYHNTSSFLGELIIGKFKVKKDIDYLIYSTAQIGTGVNRRFLVPLICEQLGFVNLTCDAYTLGLLQNKAHHFYLLSQSFKVPKTYVFRGEDTPDISMPSTEVILKPALECAALGVKKIPNKQGKIGNELRNMRETYHQDILVQEYIDGYEVCVPVVRQGSDYIALPPVWVQFDDKILTFDLVDKVKYKMTTLPDEQFPLNDLIPNLLKNSEQIMSYLGTKGITRIDYRITSCGDMYIIDIAALPVLAHTGTCQSSFSALFPENKYSIFQVLIGAGLFNSPSN